MSSKFHPNFFGLNVRRDGPQPSICVRTFSPITISRNRRMSKDYERKVQTSETLIEVAMIRLLVVRLGRWA